MCDMIHGSGGMSVADKEELYNSLDRREFMGFCAKITAALGLGAAFIPKVADAVEKGIRKPSVIWLHFAECTGDSEAFIRSSYPSTEELVLNLLSVDYHETIMAASGDQAEAALQQAMKENKGKYLAVCEGAIPTATPPGPGGKPGAYLTIAGKTGIELAREVCGGAAAVMCVGTCSSFGGVQAHFDAGQFVEKFGDQGAQDKWCLYKMGCKGPQTYHNCSSVEYNDGTSWPIKGGHGCIGCSEPAFWDQMSPFYERLPNITLPGVETTADKVGFTLVGAAAAGAAVHAAYSFANRKKFDPTTRD